LDAKSFVLSRQYSRELPIPIQASALGFQDPHGLGDGQIQLKVLAPLNKREANQLMPLLAQIHLGGHYLCGNCEYFFAASSRNIHNSKSDFL